MRCRVGLHLLSAAALLVGVAACGSGGAGGEDALIIYSGRNEQLVQPILDKLKKATGTAVEVRYGASAELAAQLLEEGENTNADLFFSQDAGALGAMSKAGRFDAVPKATLDKVDEPYRAADGTWVGTSGRARVIAYNADKVKEPPKSVYELTDPRWKGKVGIPPTNASFQAFVTAMRIKDGDDKARQWLEGMEANDFQTYESNIPVLDAVDKGEVEIGLINHYYWYRKVAELGEDNVKARISFPENGDPGALINVAGAGIVKGTDKKQAAEKALDYLLSEEAQRHFGNEIKEYPLVEGVKTDVELTPLSEIEAPDIDLGELDSLQDTVKMIKEAGLV